MCGNIGKVQSRSNIRIKAGWWLNVGGGHDFLVPDFLVDIVDSHRDVVARCNIVLRPDMVVTERWQTFEWQTGYRVVTVGYAVIVAHPLS